MLSYIIYTHKVPLISMTKYRLLWLNRLGNKSQEKLPSSAQGIIQVKNKISGKPVVHMVKPH